MVDRVGVNPKLSGDPVFMRRLQPLSDALTRYFDAEVEGLDRIPRGPALLVGNHSGGVVTADSYIFVFAWLKANGYTDIPVALGHDLIYRVPGVASLARAIGLVPASWDNAKAAFASDQKVLVYPGGHRESARPSRERDLIDLGGHYGFIKLALQAGVPVVPVVAAGAHDGWYVAARSEKLARVLLLRKLLRIQSVPIAFGLPTGILVPGMPHIPLPSKVIIEVQRPFMPTGSFDNPADVRRIYDDLSGRMQAAMDRLVARLPRSAGRGLAARGNVGPAGHEAPQHEVAREPARAARAS
jgi:1-acyl-sn-glycerol-3-phosphate acyltransferase